MSELHRNIFYYYGLPKDGDNERKEQLENCEANYTPLTECKPDVPFLEKFRASTNKD